MNADQIVLKMIFDRWYGSLKSWNTALEQISDDQLQKDVSPGKNRGIYLLGHMIAVHDDMLVLLDLGDKLYPELKEAFLASPDKAVAAIPSAATLREYWTKQCEVLKQKMDTLQPEQWFEKHTAVSAEDFSKEPHRNKLNIILTKTTNLTYHTGQLLLLK